MKYLYNSIEDGAPITEFVHNFVKYQHPVGKILQYEDTVAEAILSTYGFLQDLSRTEVEKKLEELAKAFKCKYCDKSFAQEIALSGHTRTHKDEILEEEKPLDPSIVAPAQGQATNVFNAPQVPQAQRQANPGYADDTLVNNSLDNELIDLGSFEKKGI